MSYTREDLLRAHASARVYQERYDQAFASWGMRAPEPIVGEPVDDYRRNLAVKAKRLLPDGHELKAVQFRALNDDAFNIFEPRLIKESGAAAYRSDSVPLGTERRVPYIDENGQRWNKFIAQECFVKDMTRPGRRVTSFRTDHGYVDVSGRPLR